MYFEYEPKKLCTRDFEFEQSFGAEEIACEKQKSQKLCWESEISENSWRLVVSESLWRSGNFRQLLKSEEPQNICEEWESSTQMEEKIEESQRVCKY